MTLLPPVKWRLEIRWGVMQPRGIKNLDLNTKLKKILLV